MIHKYLIKQEKTGNLLVTKTLFIESYADVETAFLRNKAIVRGVEKLKAHLENKKYQSRSVNRFRFKGYIYVFTNIRYPEDYITNVYDNLFNTSFNGMVDKILYGYKTNQLMSFNDKGEFIRLYSDIKECVKEENINSKSNFYNHLKGYSFFQGEYFKTVNSVNNLYFTYVKGDIDLEYQKDIIKKIIIFKNKNLTDNIINPIESLLKKVAV